MLIEDYIWKNQDKRIIAEMFQLQSTQVNCTDLGKSPENQAMTLSTSMLQTTADANTDQTEVSDDIEVIFDREVPKIPSILKQRSRTLSESSQEDVLSSSNSGTSRQNRWGLWLF